MGSPYVSQASSGYNSSPPPDDGSTVAANKEKWSDVKTKLGDPVKNLADAINTQLRTALDVSPTTTASNYTTQAADHLKPIEVTGTTTIKLGDCASMIAQAIGYQTTIYNKGTNTVTVGVITATDTLAGTVNGTVTIPPKGALTFCAAQSGVGYEVISDGGFSIVLLTGQAGTNTITAAAPSTLASLYPGLIVSLTPAATNTGATTLNITPSGGSALTAKNVFASGVACVGGELLISVPVLLQYDGTQFNVLGSVPTASSGGSLVLIQSQTAANSATIDFTTGITSAYNEYMVTFTDIVPASNGANLNMRISQATVFKTGANDYLGLWFGYQATPAYFQTAAAGGNVIAIATGLGNTSTGMNLSGELHISNPAGTARVKMIRHVFSYVDTSNVLTNLNGSGYYIGTTSGTPTAAIDGLRFFMASGNITSGVFSLYGIRKT